MGSAELVAILSVFGFGMAMLFFGSIKTSLQKRLGIDDARVGYLMSALLFASTPAVLFLGVLLDKLGPRKIIAFGFAGTALCLLLIGWIRSYAIILAVFILLAGASSCLNSGGNTLLPALNPDNPAAASNLGNTFFGLGALLTPVIVNLLLRRTRPDGTRAGRLPLPWTMTVLAAILLLPVALAATARYPPVSTGFAFSTAVGLLKRLPVWLGGITLFFYIGLESSVATWTTTLFTKGLRTSEGAALNRLTIFFVCLMVGRLITSQLDRIGFDVTANGAWMLVALGILAAVITYLLTVAKDLKMATIFMIVLGFCYAPMFPTTVGVTFSHFTRDVYGTVFGVIFAIGLVSASVFPAIIGRISDRRGIQTAYIVLALASVGLAVLSVCMGLA